MGLAVAGNSGGSSPPEPAKDLHFGSEALLETLDQLVASKTFSRSGLLKRLLLYLRRDA